MPFTFGGRLQERLEDAPLALADGRAERRRLLVRHVEHDALRALDRRTDRAVDRVRVGARRHVVVAGREPALLRPGRCRPPAVARNFTNASIAGLSRNVTNRSPATSTAVDGAPAGDRREREHVEAGVRLRLRRRRITPETKSASNTIAAFDGEPNAFVTESLNPYCSAPLVPPSMFDVSPRILPIVFSAVFTVGSVHLILWADSWSYFA